MKTLKISLLLLISTSVFSQTVSKTKYFRHLRYNHFSPYISISGIHPIDEAVAKKTSHYVFNYDKNNQLKEVTNNHYHTERKHPLASIGVYKLKITNKNDKVVYVFFDKNGKRIKNDKEVYKEVYEIKKGFKTKLSFYDLDDKPMESNWNISEYHWNKKGKLIIERRFNLRNQPVPLSPYFHFGTTGILLNKKGFPKTHYNLDQNLKVIENDKGTASYQDVYDEKGNHVKYSYHNAKNQLIMNQWGFAYGEKKYDSNGNQIALEQFDTKMKKIRGRKVPTNIEIEIAGKASKKDSLEIKRISLGYLIALQDLKPSLMNEVMNDSLNKNTIGWNRKEKKEVANPTTKKQMISFATSWNKSNTKFPTKPNNQVIILDIYNRVASVKLVSDNWVEYLHLIKLDKKWTIINLLWQHKDIGMYPKE